METSRREFIIKTALATAGMNMAFSTFGTPLVPDKNGFKISIFSKNLHWQDYTGAAKVAAQIGFDGVDLTVRPGGHVLPERVAEDLPKAVEAIRKAGMQVYMITTAINDPNHPHTEPILKAAGKLGIGVYRMGWISYQPNLTIPQNLEAFKATFAKLADLNKKYGIRGDYQNHSGNSLGASIWDLWLVLKDLDPQWIGCQYDIRHATVEGTNAWATGFELIRNYIHSIDIKDFQWSKKTDKWQIENVPLGQGMVDFKKYFELLRTHKLDVPISVHYEYRLGGAEEGAKELTVSPKEVTEAMKKDLLTLRAWLKEAGLT